MRRRRSTQIKSDSKIEEVRLLLDAIGKKAAGRLLDGIERHEFPNPSI